MVQAVGQKLRQTSLTELRVLLRAVLDRLHHALEGSLGGRDELLVRLGAQQVQQVWVVGLEDAEKAV